MSRCPESFDFPTASPNDFAVGQSDIGGEGGVDSFTATDLSGLGEPGHGLGTAVFVGAEGVNRGTGPARKGNGEGRMVEMGMGHEDMGNLFAGRQRGKDRFEMLLGVRAGIYDGDVAASDDIGIRSVEGHRGGVGR